MTKSKSTLEAEMSKLPMWEEVHLNPKIFCPGTLYRCRKCKTEILVPYGYSVRFVQSYVCRYCPTCKTQEIFLRLD